MDGPGTAVPTPESVGNSMSCERDQTGVAESTFDRWYKKPLRRLKELPNGDGGFVALVTACVLYERYARAMIIRKNPGLKNKRIEQKEVAEQLARDLDSDAQCDDESLCREFWKVTRHGLVHHAMLQVENEWGQDLPGWHLHHKYKKPLQWRKSGEIIGIQPFLFSDWVLSLWERHPELVAEDKHAPWGAIF